MVHQPHILYNTDLSLCCMLTEQAMGVVESLNLVVCVMYQDNKYYFPLFPAKLGLLARIFFGSLK